MRAEAHPFVRNPHRTLVALSFPVLVSLIAEPLTGLVDTVFVSRLGAAPLAALGVAATVISGVLWIFNFLGIGTQTEVARAEGQGAPERSGNAAWLAMALAAAFGTVLCLAFWPLAETLMAAMGTTGQARADGAAYLAIRLLGGPAVLITIAGFGALRGLQDMRTPLAIAVGTNVLNALLDPVLIFGLGPVPRLELAGAAWASTASQWIGAALVAGAVSRRLGRPRRLAWADATRLLTVGRDLFFRTGALMVFLILATAAANRLGTDSGAAHQVVRQIWIFTAFVLDAYATAAQSLIGYFHGAGHRALARRVAGIGCAWALGTGIGLAAAMWLGGPWVASALVPDSARTPFFGAWAVAAWSQPLNALSFATDGIHWGTGDYRYLRNAMAAATVCGAALLAIVPDGGAIDLAFVWWATAAWIGVRAAFGVLRIWPGIGASPLARRDGGA